MRIGFLLLFLYAHCWLLHAREPLHIQEVEKVIPLNVHLDLLTDVEGTFTLEQVLDASLSRQFQPYDSIEHPLDPTQTHWVRFQLHHGLNHQHAWMLHGRAVGLAELYVIDSAGTMQMYRSGRNMPASQKVENRGAFLHFPLDLDAQMSYDVYLKVWEIDHQSISVSLSLQDQVYWRSQQHIRLEAIILFFLGIFGIMALYNFVLYAVIRFPAYLYYAFYLICVGTFVLFAVGPMSHPPFGNPRWLVPLGHLAFGSINIFYYLFGRSFLNLKELLPKWDLWLHRYIIFKTVLIILSQIELYTVFHLPMALGVEFSLLLVDVFLSLFFFFALLRTKHRLAYYFIGGSGSVIVIGLSLAVIGHLFGLRHTFVIFLSTIVVEIIFFSLGLGYRIRLTEQQKLEAEREKRLAQEALNEELSKYNVAFKRFVPHEFLRSLGHQSVLDVGVGDGVEKRVTVLFSDIRDYTTLSEQMTPKENFDFLNTYLGIMGPIIQRYQGFVNQYYGDGIMALFLEGPDDAIQASLEMMRSLREFNVERAAKQQSVIRIGIGLHTGPLMMGVLGDRQRMDAGVVSDTVNTAARMEGLTKHYGAKILLSDQTWAGVEDPSIYDQRFLGKVQVKGKKDPLGVFECVEISSDEEKHRFEWLETRFELGLSSYFDQEFSSAIACFEEILERVPTDKASSLYLELSRRHLEEGVPQNWDGVKRMIQK